jgi:hypothetical protein
MSTAISVKIPDILASQLLSIAQETERPEYKKRCQTVSLALLWLYFIKLFDLLTMISSKFFRPVQLIFPCGISHQSLSAMPTVY